MNLLLRRSLAVSLALPLALALVSGPFAGAAEPLAQPPIAEDHWYVVEMLGQRAGYMHVETRPVEHRGRPAVRSLMEMRNEITRLNGGLTETVVVASRTAWLEDLEGRSLSIEHRLDQGGGEVVTEVEIRGDRARLTSTSGGRTREAEIPWSDEVMGPKVSEREVESLLSGEKDKVTLKTFSFEAGHKILELEIRVVERLEDGSTVLEQTLTGLGVTIRETYDRQGLLVLQEVGPMAVRLASREEALAPLEESLAAFEQTAVGLDRPLPGARALSSAAYRLVPREGAESLRLGDLFVEDRRQRIERHGDDEILRVEVPEEPGAARGRFDPAPYLRASSLIDSEDPEIARLARRVAGGTEGLEAAKRLERWVRDNVRFLGSGVGLATARQTLDSRDGDCTENAFLLTALLRAVGIPARLVVGLVHVGSAEGSFVPHAWVEAHAGDWVALDSAVYAERVDATHLAMAKSAGEEEGALLELTVPLLNGMGKFDLAWVSPEDDS